MKKCKKCGESFPATTEYFFSCSRTKSGLRAQCKGCHRKVAQSSQTREKARLLLRDWRKRNPKKLKEQWTRSNTKKSASGYHSEYYNKNKNSINERRNKWLQDTGKGVQYVHKRRSLMKEDVTQDEWQQVLDFYGNRCLVPDCTNEDVTQDHVVPLSLGGRNHISNLQPLCRSHNCQKHTQTTDYRPDLGLRFTDG